jgi:hypothetical protein
MIQVCSNSDVSNDILFRQEDKDFHQVKSWPPTQQLVIKSIVPNFGLSKEAFAMHLGVFGCSDQDLALALSLSLFIFL